MHSGRERGVADTGDRGGELGWRVAGHRRGPAAELIPALAGYWTGPGEGWSLVTESVREPADNPTFLASASPESFI
jgi:hypothetical protein